MTIQIHDGIDTILFKFMIKVHSSYSRFNHTFADLIKAVYRPGRYRYIKVYKAYIFDSRFQQSGQWIRARAGARAHLKRRGWRRYLRVEAAVLDLLLIVGTARP